MQIKDIENLAELAKIELNDTEKQVLLKDMDGILAYVKQVEELKIPDTKTNFSLYNTWREDLPRLSQAGQAKAPDHFEVSIKEKAERNMANDRVLDLVAEYFKIPKRLFLVTK